MKKAVVTGACGFVGRALVSYLCDQGAGVLAVGRPGTGDRLPARDGLRFVGLDLAEIQRLPEIVGDRDFDVFYHLGWVGAYGPYKRDIAQQFKNAEWAVACVPVADRLGCGKFIGVGSIAEYETIAAAETEGSEPSPNQIYGAGKLMARYMGEAAASLLDGLDYLWLTVANTYGPAVNPPWLVNSLIGALLRGETPELTACTQMYDFIYIDDLAASFYWLGEKGKPYQKYIAGSGKPRPLREFMLELRDAVKPGAELRFGAVPFKGQSLTAEHYDNSALVRDTGYAPKVSFAEGVRRTRDWILQTGGASHGGA